MMRTPIARLLALAVAASLAAAAPAPPAVAAPGPCTNTNLDDVTFVLKRNRHYSKPHGLRKWKLKREFSRTEHFQLRFDDTVRYTATDPQNQWDWNKVMGFSTYRIHKNSIRIGWRYNPSTDMVELGYYGYLNKVRHSKKLVDLPIGQWADCEIGLDNDGMYVEIDGVRHAQTGDLNLPDGWLPISTWALRTAYFGGQEKAAHSIRVEVRGIVVDEACQR